MRDRKSFNFLGKFSFKRFSSEKYKSFHFFVAPRNLVDFLMKVQSEKFSHFKIEFLVSS